MSVWATLIPLVRGSLVRLGLLLVAIALVLAALQGVRYGLTSDWQKARAQRQSARTLLEQSRKDQNDVQVHGPAFAQLQAGGLFGAEQRAAWVDDLMQGAAAMGLQEATRITLHPPQTVPLPQADAAQMRVTRHPLEYSIVRAHELEVVDFTDRFLRAHGSVARLTGCVLENATPQGLSAHCRMNLLHIDRAMRSADNRLP